MITPILLAAGASARMGRPKALCEFDGRTCLELALDACRGQARPTVVLGAAAEEIRARVPLGGATVVLNDRWERGQTSSLKAGLRALPPQAEAFLLYPVDFPLVTAEDVEALAAAWGKRAHGKRIFIPSRGGRRGHPVLFDAALREAFLRLPDEAPARTVVGANDGAIEYVTDVSPHVLMDMDTPEDYARCLEMYRTWKSRARR